MQNTQLKILLQKKLYPSYYKDFHCIMGACQDNCCREGAWRITFDKEDYQRLRHLEGASANLQEKLRQTVKRVKGSDIPQEYYKSSMFYGELRLLEGHCPLLTEDCLCSIQKECGGEVLPFVCQVFPRNEHYTALGKELALSTACEGVLKQLWDLPGGVEFVEEALPREEWRNAVCKPERAIAMDFPKVQPLCIDILQDRTLTLGERMLLLGLAVQDLQKQDWAHPNVDKWAAVFSSMLGQKGTADLLKPLTDVGNRPMYISQNLQVLMQMTGSLRGEILDILVENMKMIDQDGKSHPQAQVSLGRYLECLEMFDKTFGDIEYFFENIMVNLVFYTSFPALMSPEALWKSYINLCNFYSFYRFVSVLSVWKKPDRNYLFHILVLASRELLHSAIRQSNLQEQFFQNSSATLAHMAILING